MIGVDRQRLAVDAHLQEANGMLDLRTSGDEIDFLRPSVQTVWRSWLSEVGDADAALELASDYGFGDPYGERRGAEALAAHHRAHLEAGAFSFSAGISGLLRQLADLAAGRIALVERLGHSDFSYWAQRAGSAVDTFENLESLPARVHALRPSVVVVDRPNARGDLLSWDSIRELTSVAARTGTVVLIDEAHANYLGPDRSLAPRVRELERLVVLRSLSKGYRMGGLRVGYAVAAPDVKAEVRQRIAPMGTSSMPFSFGLRLLAAGDMFAELRRRTAIAKQETIRLLLGNDLSTVPMGPPLPWVLIEDRQSRASRILESRGVASRKVPLGAGGDSELVKVAVPLSEARRQAFADRLAP
jgi:histidinol-phosphate/aromatic aminotransferase/cobyric acid decarboxylase-like protein